MISLPARFSQNWTLDDTRRYFFDQEFPTEGTAQEKNKWSEEVGEPLLEKMASLLGQHVAWVSQSGIDVLPPDSEKLQTPQLIRLRALLKNPEEPDVQTTLGHEFSEWAIRLFEFFKRDIEQKAKDTGIHREDQIRWVHIHAVERLEQGNFLSNRSSGNECQNTGLKVTLEFKGWQSRAGLFRFVSKPEPGKPHYELDPIPAEMLVEPTTQAFPIPVPSGRLLITDWFLLDAFHALAVPLDDQHGNISTVKGRMDRTKAYAEELGVVHVFGRGPSILENLGVLKAGYVDPNLPTPSNSIGKVYADLRWTTVVDRQHLVGLLAKTLGAEEAEIQLKALEKENQGNIVYALVEPGTHHLYCAGDPATFKKTVGQEFQAEGLYLEDFTVPFFALTQSPLQPALAVTPPAPARSPRP